MKILSFLPKKYKLTITLLIIIISNFLPVVNNNTAAKLALSYIGYLSICSTLFILIIIVSKLYNNKVVTFSYTSLSFIAICIIFYGCFFISSYKLYDIGFNAYIVVPFIFTYGFVLLLISKRFIVFNAIFLAAVLASLSYLLQINIWNYLIDPVLIIICLIELLSDLIIFLKKKERKYNSS